MSLTDWQNDFAALPRVGDSSWKQNLGDYLSEQLDGILNFDTYNNLPSFTFGVSAFVGGLTDTNGIVGLQAAFEAGVLASTWTIPIGTTFGAATPAETFSTAGVATVDAASIVAGKAKIAELSSAPKVGDPLLSEFPVKLREAFLALAYTITGTNSVAPTPGPINDVGRAVTNI